jgi:carboxymethylenebutenolidase
MPSKPRPEVDINSFNQMQIYLGTEMIEDWQEGQLSRRKMLKRLIFICGSSAGAAALLTACGQPVNTPPTAAPKPTDPPKPTDAPKPAEAVKPTAPPPPPTPSKPGVMHVPPDDPAVQASTVTFENDVKITGYLAKPKAAGSYPGIIVIHEVARRLAKAGYIALAPDLVSRGGGTIAVGDDKVPGWLSQAKPEDLFKDLSTAVDYLEKQGIAAGKLGVVGFCFGGAQTIQLAVSNPKIKAAVPYYGPTPKTIKPFAETNAAILAQYGGTDQRVNGTIPDIENGMKDAKKVYEKKIWDGAGHAFNNDRGANYNEQTAVEAWKLTLDWFKKYLA